VKRDTDSDSFREMVLSSRAVYKGRAVKLRVDKVRLPNGRETSRDVIEHPGSVAVLPFLTRNRILLIRQYRHAVGKTIWEIPAGTMEPEETPKECALRELEEETGFRAGSLKPLFELCPTPGYSAELMHVFQARGLRETKRGLEEDEIISVKPFLISQALKMIRMGGIMDGKTIAALLYLQAFGR
jgi:ADP-ribose pyrophosphatase